MNTVEVIIMCCFMIFSIGFYIFTFEYVMDKKCKNSYKNGYEIGYEYGYQKGLHDQEQYNVNDDEMERAWADVMEMVTVNE